MKIKITYLMPVEEVVEMTPEEYCDFHAGVCWDKYFPVESISQKIEIVDEKSKQELDNFFSKN